MKKFLKKIIFISALFFFEGLNFNGTVATKSFAVIANPQAGISEMKYSDLVIVMKGEKPYWKNGSKVIIALLKTSTPAGNDIAETIYGMSGDELNKYWLSLVFQGKAAAPNFFDSENDLKLFVAKTKGAIGIITSEAILENDNCVLIDGKKFFMNAKQ